MITEMLLCITCSITLGLAVCCATLNYFKSKRIATYIAALKTAAGVSQSKQEKHERISQKILNRINEQADTRVYLLPNSLNKAMSKTFMLLEGPANTWLKQHAYRAGLTQPISAKTCVSYALIHGLLYGIFACITGFFISYFAAFVFFLVGLVVGLLSPFWAIQKEEQIRSESLSQDLPNFLDIVALGLASGMSFDKSFALYSKHFHTPLAQVCNQNLQELEIGVINKDQALDNLAGAFNSKIFDQLVQDIKHALHSGTGLTTLFSQAAKRIRSQYKTSKQEANAKAPVKMMLPIGCLILPAMLLMVLGPVLLDVINGF